MAKEKWQNGRFITSDDSMSDASSEISDNVIEKLIRDLDNQNEIESSSKRRLIEIGAPAVERLIDKLDVQGFCDTDIRWDVVEILSKIGPDAVDPLISRINISVENSYFNYIAIALGRIKDIRAVDPLIVELDNRNILIVIAAAKALGLIGDKRAIKPLLNKINIASPIVEIMDALGELKAIEAIELLSKVISTGNVNLSWRAAEALGKIGNEQATEILFDAIKSENEIIKGAGARGLGETKIPDAVEPLIRLSSDSSGRVRNNSIIALKILGDSRANKVFVQHAIKDDMLEIRIESLEGLRICGDEDVVKPLISLLSDPALSIRTKAALALGNIGSSQAVKPLIKVLESSTINIMNSPQGAAAKALGMIGDKQAVKPLINALQHSNPEVKREALSALMKYDTPEALSAIKLLK